MAGAFQPLAMTGLGMVTAVGMDAAQTCASVRAGISRLREHPFFFPQTHDPGWDEEEPLIAGMAPGIDPALALCPRLVAMATGALAPLVGASKLKRADLTEAALLVALPSRDSVVQPASLPDRFVPELMKATGLARFSAVEVCDAGSTAVFELLETAGALLGARKAAFCILLAVDSYLSEDRLLLLDEARRIRSRRNVDGFLPGEAAVAMVLEPVVRARTRQVEILATITRVAFGNEPQTLTSDRQSSGAGLTQALRQVLEGVEPPGMSPWVLCDMNGESYRGFEWGLTVARLPNRLGSVKRLTHPADCMGDVGAAFGGVLLGLSAEAFRRGYAPAARSVLWTASEGSSRAAALVEAAADGT